VNDDANIDAMDDGLALYLQDDIASRPAAGIEGRYFWSIDESLLYYDDGAAWHCVAAGSATQGSLPYVDAATKYALLAPGTAHYPLVSGGAGANPGYESISEILDALIGSTRGGLLCRGAGGWVLIEPDTAGYVLTDGGAGADPAWATLATLLNQILTTRGDLLYRGSGDAARLAKGSQYSVLSMGADDPAWATVSSLLDSVLGSTEGMVAKRGAATWSGEVPTSYRYVLFLPQSFGYPATNPAELIEWVGTNTTRQEARFDDTTEEFVTGGFPVPADYDSSGTITIMVIGRSLTAAASKNVAFTFRHLPLADSEAMDVAYSSSASGNSATDATQGDLEVHSWTVGTPGWTAGDWVDFKLSRNPSATNNLTGDWCLRAMVLKIPVTG
jgi:hypothetical protein